MTRTRVARPHYGATLSTRLHPAPCWRRFDELLIAVLPMTLLAQPIDRPTAFPSAALCTTTLPPPTASPVPPLPLAVLPITVPPPTDIPCPAFSFEVFPVTTLLLPTLRPSPFVVR